MPTYEYDCTDCGAFSAVRPMVEFRDPQPCPKCAKAAPRVTLTVPALHGMFSAPSSAGKTLRMQSCCGGGCSCS